MAKSSEHRLRYYVFNLDESEHRNIKKGSVTDSFPLQKWIETGHAYLSVSEGKKEIYNNRLKKLIPGTLVFARKNKVGLVAHGVVMESANLEIRNGTPELYPKTYLIQKVKINWKLIDDSDIIKGIHNNNALFNVKKPEHIEKIEIFLINISQKEKDKVVASKAIEEDFEKLVQASLDDKSTVRLSRLNGAKKLPDQIQVYRTEYRRNPDVVAEVRIRANGICEYCRKSAPFFRPSNGQPFLEVHHKKRLADGGEDTVENAIAVCPNCHRELHYG